MSRGTCDQHFAPEYPCNVGEEKCYVCQLVAACETVVNWYENAGTSDPAPGSVELWVQCREALAAAKEKP